MDKWWQTWCRFLNFGTRNLGGHNRGSGGTLRRTAGGGGCRCAVQINLRDWSNLTSIVVANLLFALVTVCLTIFGVTCRSRTLYNNVLSVLMQWTGSMVRVFDQRTVIRYLVVVTLGIRAGVVCAPLAGGCHAVPPVTGWGVKWLTTPVV